MDDYTDTRQNPIGEQQTGVDNNTNSQVNAQNIPPQYVQPAQSPPASQSYPQQPPAPYQPYPQQYRQAPYYPPAPPACPPYYYRQPPQQLQKPAAGLATASLVISLISLALCWVPILNILLSITAIILGIVAKVKGSGGIAIAGIVIGAVSFVSAIAILIPLLFYMTSIDFVEEFNNEFNFNYDYDWQAAFTGITRYFK